MTDQEDIINKAFDMADRYYKRTFRHKLIWRGITIVVFAFLIFLVISK